jgi:hypothetical protein
MRVRRFRLFSRVCVPLVALAALTGTANAADSAAKPLTGPFKFVPHRVDNFRSEACCVADFNGDGKLDILAGENLYLAPEWKQTKVRTIQGTVDLDGKGYRWDFANIALDVDRDGRPDLISVDWFQKHAVWFRNTGATGGEWPQALIEENGNFESADPFDIDGDGKAQEILPHVQRTVWYDVLPAGEGKHGFGVHVVSEKLLPFGGGVGDLNGDGRPDIIRPSAWFEAPADPRKGQWKEHPIALGHKDPSKSDHTAQILVLDVNGDGLNDIIASSAHEYGIFWYEQVRDGSKIEFKQRLIDNSWSQAHSLALGDLDGDGKPELVVGKRFMAHNGSDPDEYGPLGVYAYKLHRQPTLTWVKHIISYNEGIGSGMNINLVDLDRDADLDIVVTGDPRIHVSTPVIRPGPSEAVQARVQSLARTRVEQVIQTFSAHFSRNAASKSGTRVAPEAKTKVLHECTTASRRVPCSLTGIHLGSNRDITGSLTLLYPCYIPVISLLYRQEALQDRFTRARLSGVHPRGNPRPSVVKPLSSVPFPPPKGVPPNTLNTRKESPNARNSFPCPSVPLRGAPRIFVCLVCFAVARPRGAAALDRAPRRTPRRTPRRDSFWFTEEVNESNEGSGPSGTSKTASVSSAPSVVNSPFRALPCPSVPFRGAGSPGFLYSCLSWWHFSFLWLRLCRSGAVRGCWAVSTAVIHIIPKTLDHPRKPLLSSVQPAGDNWSTFLQAPTKLRTRFVCFVFFGVSNRLGHDYCLTCVRAEAARASTPLRCPLRVPCSSILRSRIMGRC